MKNISEAETDKQLHSLFSSAGTIPAPEGFTRHLMEKIEEEKVCETVYEPVISKTGWLVIGVSTVVFIALVVFVASSSGSASTVLQRSADVLGLFLMDKFFRLFSGSAVLLSITAVLVVMGWQYLFMQSRSTGGRSRFHRMSLF